jgi:hypothetical protein
MAASGHDAVVELLDNHQLRKYLDTLDYLRLRPNQWVNFRVLDDMVVGPRLKDFPPAWLDYLQRVCTRPNAPLALRVEIVTATRRVQPKPEPPSGDHEVGDDENEGDGVDESVTILCTSSDDPEHQKVELSGRLAEEVASRCRPVSRLAKRQVGTARMFLRYCALHVRRLEDFLGALADTQRSVTTRMGISTTSLYVTNEAQQIVQRAVDYGNVYFVPGFKTANTGKSRRTAGPRRATQTTAGDDNEEGNEGDGDLAIGGDAGGINADDISLGQGQIVDFTTWLRSAPVTIRHRRIVDGVELEEGGLPAIFRPTDADTKVIIARREPRPPESAPFSGDIMVSLVLSNKLKCVEIPVQQQVLRGTSQLEFVIRPREAGKGAVEVRLSCQRYPRTPASVGTRPVATQQGFEVSWDRRRPVVFYHKYLDDDNLFTQYGLENVADVLSPRQSLDKLLCPPPQLSAALARNEVSAAEVTAMQARLFVDAYAELRRKERAVGGVPSSTSDDDDIDDVKTAGTKAAYERYHENRHMLAYGIDLRKPYKPSIDSKSSVLTRIGAKRERVGHR